MTTPAAARAQSPSVAVVGGGVAGLSAARALAAAGATVVLFDAARPGEAGASSLPVALVNPWRGRKGAAHPDDLRGQAAVWRWADELAREGRPTGAHRAGVLRIATSARQAREWRARAEGPEGVPLAWRPPERVPAPYRAPFGALLVRDGGWIEPRLWLAALAASATAHGATLRAGVPVERAERHRDGSWRLLGRSGDELITAGRLLICVGADPSPALAHGGAPSAEPAWTRTRGEVVTLAGGPALPHPVAGAVYGASHPGRGRPGEAGLTSIGGGHRPADAADATAAHDLRRAFGYSVPALAEAEIVATWSGVRARTPDGRPLIAEAAPGAWWFGGFGGRGFLCAAFEAERLAEAWRTEVR